MAGANIANQQQAKISYLPKLASVLDNTVTVRSLAIKDDKWTGDRREFRVHVGRSGAVQYAEDGGDFPIEGNQSVVKAYAYRKALHAKVGLTDMSMAAIRGDGAYKDALKMELEGIMKDIQVIENWFAWRDGTGVVGELTDATLASGNTDVPVTDGRFLKQFRGSSMKFEIWNSALTTKRGSVTVSNVDNFLNASGYAVVDFSASVSGAQSGDKIVMQNSVNRAITGLKKLIDDSAATFQGVDVSTYPEYSSLVYSNSGTLRALTPNLLRRFMADRRKKLGSAMAKREMNLHGTSSMLIELEEMYEGDLRLAPTSKTGGIAVSAFQSILGTAKIVPDDDMLYNTLFLVDYSDINRGVQQPLGFRRSKQGGSSGFLTPSQQSAKYEGTLIEFADYYIKDRISSARLDDLNEQKTTAF